MVKQMKGSINGSKLKIAIVVSRFNELVTTRLLEGCIDELIGFGVADKDIKVVWVPGSLEIPAVAKKVSNSRDIDAVICLGTVIRGATPHFDFVSSESVKGIAKIAQESKPPVVMGIITADSFDQALDRAGLKEGNRGRDAARYAIECVNLYKKL